MKIYISVDIEGAAGIAHWDEASPTHPDYHQFQERMTAEAVAAANGALAAGATEIWMKDAHNRGRNILAEVLPPQVRLIRGWSGHPYGMLQELDQSFDAVAMVGWHGAAADGGNTLSHTLYGNIARITLNDQPCSEYLISTHIAALEGVPVVFLSGDASICAQARQTNPAMRTVETFVGRGDSVVSVQPARARELIEAGMEAACRSDRTTHTLPRADQYHLSIRFTHHAIAFAKSFYPGARLVDAETIEFVTDDFFEIARLLGFMK